MKRYLSLILILVATCSFVACSSSKGGDDSETPTLSLSASSLSFDATGGESSVTVTASGTWKATVETAASSWCTVSTSGNNLAVKTTANTSTTERTATVTVALTGASLSQTLKVTQAGATASTFAKGADISWVTEMENAGKKFYDSTGTETDCFTLMKNLGMNMIRLRVWVNPADGWNGQEDVVKKAVRAKEAGLEIMLDFHYSDTWADPNSQTKPADWKDKSLEELKTAIADHTKSVLNALKEQSITPKWVQIGNEVGSGMLFDTNENLSGATWEVKDSSGSTIAKKNLSNFVAFINAAYEAVKSVDTSILVIVHRQDGQNESDCKWLFEDVLKNAKYDIIGLSLYPDATNYATYISQCMSTIKTLKEDTGKDCMIVETGMSWDAVAASKNFLTQLITESRKTSCLGVIYWEPESYAQWNGYTKGAFDNSGKPTEAMDAFKN